MKNAQGENYYAVEPFDIPQEVDESGEETVIRLMTRYNLSRAVCMEMICEVMEAFGGCRGRAGDGEALQKLEARHRQAWHILVAYQSNQKTALDMQMATRAMALELGYYTVAGADNVADLARQLGIKKQTVDKCARNFQSRLGLPPRPGQRDELARKNMKSSRVRQLGNAESSHAGPVTSGLG